MNPNVSVFILTLNEEHNIESCLESISWADEIIIGDTGSTDNTISLANKYTDKVYRIPFQGHAKSKEVLASKTKNEWVFSLDADEHVTQELQHEITEIISNSDEYNSIDGLWILRRNFFWKKPMHCLHDDYQLRVYKKSKGIWNDAKIHCGVELNGATMRTRYSIDHFTYPDLHHYLRKMNPYTTADAMDLASNPTQFGKISVFSAFARGMATFYKYFVARGGWRDGSAGVVLCFYYAVHNVTRYLKAYEFIKGITPVPDISKIKSL